MFDTFIQLVILFAVIFDPPASFAVFLTASASLKYKERKKMATLALVVASGLSIAVILLGEGLLSLFSTTLNEFKIAGGIILTLLGIRMAMGYPMANLKAMKNNTGRAVAAIIGTPLLTGPAAITAIIVSVNDYGRILTTLAVALVLGITAIIFYQSKRLNKYLNATGIQVITTVFGLITVAWGVKFMIAGLHAVW